jgi:hypothetical protein
MAMVELLNVAPVVLFGRATGPVRGDRRSDGGAVFAGRLGRGDNRGMVIRRLALIPAVILVLAGLVWILQGIGVIKGSFMTGSQTWEVIGFVVLIVGLIIGRFGLSRRRRS